VITSDQKPPKTPRVYNKCVRRRPKNVHFLQETCPKKRVKKCGSDRSVCNPPLAPKNTNFHHQKPTFLSFWVFFGDRGFQKGTGLVFEHILIWPQRCSFLTFKKVKKGPGLTVYGGEGFFWSDCLENFSNTYGNDWRPKKFMLVRSIGRSHRSFQQARNIIYIKYSRPKKINFIDPCWACKPWSDQRKN